MAKRHNGEYDYLCNMVFYSWKEMKKAMVKRFGDHYEQETYCEKLDHITQGYKRVHQYIEEFVITAYKAKYPKDIEIKHLYGGVNKDLWDTCKT